MQPEVVNVDHATITTVSFEEQNRLLIIIDLNERRMAFPLQGYSVIQEFMTMLSKPNLLKGGHWDGPHFRLA